MNNLEKFLETVKQDKCTPNMELILSPSRCGSPCFGPFRHYNAKDMKKLAEAIASGRCKSGLTIHIESNVMKDDGARELVVALRSANRPDNLEIHLSGNKLSDEGLNDLMEAVVEGPITGLTLGLDGDLAFVNGYGCGTGDNIITDNGAKIIADSLFEMIVNNKGPKHLSLDLQDTNIDDKGATFIAERLEEAMRKNKSGVFDFHVYLSSDYISYHIIERIQDLLMDLRTRENLLANQGLFAKTSEKNWQAIQDKNLVTVNRP